MTIKTWQERTHENQWQSDTTEYMQAEIDELRAEVVRLMTQCGHYMNVAYKAKIEAKTLIEHAEKRLEAWEKQKPAAWLHKGGHVQVSSEYLSKRHADEYSSHKDWVCLYTKPKEVT